MPNTTTWSPKHRQGGADVIIADPLTDANQILLRNVRSLRASWELSRAGMLSCQAQLTDLRDQDIWLDPRVLVGRWIHYTHPTAGDWGGIITAIDVDIGTVTINAESWASALRGAITTGLAPFDAASTLDYEIDINSAATGVIRGATASQSSLTTPPEFWAAGQSVYDDILPSLLEQTWALVVDNGDIETGGGQYIPLQLAGWNIDPVTRDFTFLQNYGTVHWEPMLTDGRHNTDSGWTDDITDIINWVRVEAKVNIDFKKGTEQPPPGIYGNTIAQATVIGINPVSIARYGVQPTSVSDDTVYPSLAALQEVATRRAMAWSRNRQRVTIECVDIDDVWSRFREGDMIYVQLGLSNAKGFMVARQRALNVDRGTMTVSGEAELTQGL
jgi:hypothetical protein